MMEVPYDIEASLLICIANHQWTGFYIIGTSSLKELSKNSTSFATDGMLFQKIPIQSYLEVISLYIFYMFKIFEQFIS